LENGNADPNTNTVADVDANTNATSNTDPDANTVADVDANTNATSNTDPDANTVADVDANTNTVADVDANTNTNHDDVSVHCQRWRLGFLKWDWYWIVCGWCDSHGHDDLFGWL